MPTRRHFLAGTAALAAGLSLMLASPHVRAQPGAALLTRKVPSTGEALPVIGAGTSGSSRSRQVPPSTSSSGRCCRCSSTAAAGSSIPRKNVIDTVVYRGGDALSGWVKRGLDVMGEHPQLAMLIGAGIALGWAATGGWLGRRQRRLEEQG